MSFGPKLAAKVLGWVTRPLASHIRWKIVAPYLLLTVAVAVAGTFIATRLVTGSLQDRFDNQLAESARVASDSVVRRERQHLTVVRGIAFTVGVPEQTQAANPTALRPLVEPLAANSKAEYVEVVGLDGKRVLGLRLTDPSRLTYGSLLEPVDRSNLVAVQTVLAKKQDSLGDKFAQIVGVNDGAAIYTAGPIYDGDKLVGVVLVGTLLETLLPAIQHEALADVTVYGFDGQVLATTFEEGPQSEVDLTPAVALPRSESVTGFRERKSLFGRNFDLLYGELRIRDETVGLYSIGLPSAFISNAGTTARWEMTAIFALATAFVLCTGVLVARSVTAPLIRLVRTARAVTAGDLQARTEIHSNDEVGRLAESFDTMTARLAQQHLQTIRALTSAIDARDPYTAGHSVRVGQLGVEIGRALELPKRDLQFLEIGGYLHDVGKIGIRDNVLLKADSLTPDERALIEEHPRIGLSIIQHVDLAPEVLQVVGGHHEKLDGSGYPNGVRGNQLTIFSRISAAADIYDALTTDRPYRPGLTVERAVTYLKDESTAGHLDPAVIEALIRVLPIWGRRLRTDDSLKGLLIPELGNLDIERTAA